MQREYPVRQVVDLTQARHNSIFNMSVEDARVGCARLSVKGNQRGTLGVQTRVPFRLPSSRP